jgi:hypothetical protein
MAMKKLFLAGVLLLATGTAHTRRHLNLTIPPSVTFRTDEVIE